MSATLLLGPSLLPAQQNPRPNYSQRFAALAADKSLTDSVRLHRLFALDWEFTNVEYPGYATYTGYPGQNDRWTDLSVAAINRRLADVKTTWDPDNVF